LRLTCLVNDEPDDLEVQAALRSAIREFKNIRVADVDGGLTSDSLIEFAGSNPALRALTITTIPTPNHVLSSLLDFIPRLTCIKLYDAEGFSWAKHPSLARLDLFLRSSEGTEPVLELLGSNLPSLEEFTSWTLHDALGDVRPRIISGFPILKRVDLLTCPGATLSNLPALEYLNLHVTQPCKIVIKNAPNLEELDLTFPAQSDLDSFEFDVEIPGLKKLICRKEENYPVQEILKLSLLSCAHQLERLHLDWEDADAELHFDEIFKCCPSLKVIQFNGDASQPKGV
jgi:hypothetical protein